MGTIKKVDQTTSQRATSTAPAKKGKVKSKPADRFVQHGVSERDLIKRLNNVLKMSSPKGDAALARIVRNHWSDSPEFARTFLRATNRFYYNADLSPKIKRAILNLLPKDADPPQTFDESHTLVIHSIRLILLARLLINSPDPMGRKGEKLIRDLAAERPRYKDFLYKLLFTAVPTFIE